MIVSPAETAEPIEMPLGSKEPCICQGSGKFGKCLPIEKRDRKCNLAVSSDVYSAVLLSYRLHRLASILVLCLVHFDPHLMQNLLAQS